MAVSQRKLRGQKSGKKPAAVGGQEKQLVLRSHWNELPRRAGEEERT